MRWLVLARQDRLTAAAMRRYKLTRLRLRPTRCIGWRGWCKWTPVEPAGTCPGYKSSKLGGSEDPWTTGARDDHSGIGRGSLECACGVGGRAHRPDVFERLRPALAVCGSCGGPPAGSS